MAKAKPRSAKRDDSATVGYEAQLGEMAGPLRGIQDTERLVDTTL